MHVQARLQFGCATLQGAALEDQGGSGSADSHWEYELFQVGTRSGSRGVLRSMARSQARALLWRTKGAQAVQTATGSISSSRWEPDLDPGVCLDLLPDLE